MQKGSFLAGLLAGMVLAGLMVFILMPGMMINVRKSRLDFNETVAAVKKSVEANSPWKVPAVVDIQKNIVKAGHEDMTRVKIVTLCQPHYAHKILSSDEDKKVSTIMPLGIGIYETSGGEVFISDMNVSLLGMMFGGTIAEVMGRAGADISNILEGITE